ncbi:hypothetical protein SAMN04487915_111166 [Arthrobacter sp. ov118]|nr:hypothetical protein SAMN04487915_111166 [Arthrobacter sp. ov118]
MATSQGVGLPGKAPHAPAHPGTVSNWSELVVGERVLLVGAGRDRFTGAVDDVSADGTVMWLVLEDGDGRRLFHQADSYQTIVDPNSR